MNLGMVFKVAVLAILRNKTRSLLTCLGIIVGIAAVIAVMAIGQGAKTMMVATISSMGDNLVMVFPERHHPGAVSSGRGQGQTLTAGDAEAVKKELSHLVKGVSPMLRLSVQMMYGAKNWAGNVQGVSTDITVISNWQVTDGRFFTEDEQRRRSRVCLVGTTVLANLFDGENPVGKTLRLNNMTFTVIGVLGSRGANNWGQDQDDVVLLPYTSAERFLQRSKFGNINMMNISLYSMDTLEEARREVKALLRQRHRLADYQDDDFELRDTTEIMNTIGSTTQLMTVLLTAVAAISLLVGGIGIMNIMLVSVTERIREIGLRMAIGARPASILWQFILEAVVLSTVGGALGVALGVGVAQLIGELQHWPIAVELVNVVAAFLFSALVGMFFGFYPAYRASKLNPIDCLRYE